MWPGSQCLLIPKLNHVGRAQGWLNGSQTIQHNAMIGMCTVLHHHQYGNTVQQCFKITHVNSTHHPLLAFGCITHNGLWMEYPLYLLGQVQDQMWVVCGVWHRALLFLCSMKKATITLNICALYRSSNSIFKFPCLHCTNAGDSCIHTL